MLNSRYNAHSETGGKRSEKEPGFRDVFRGSLDQGPISKLNIIIRDAFPGFVSRYVSEICARRIIRFSGLRPLSTPCVRTRLAGGRALGEKCGRG